MSSNLAKAVAQESRMQTMGIMRYRKQLREAEEKGRVSHMGAGAQMLSAVVPRLAARIKSQLRLGKRNLPGPVPSGWKELKRLKPEVAALITLRTVLDLMTQRRKITSMTNQLGGRIEDELRLQQFKKEDRVSYKNALKQVVNSQDYRYKHKVMVGLMAQCATAENWESWGTRKRVAVGGFLLAQLMETTDWLCTVTYEEAQMVVPSHSFTEQLKARHSVLEELRPWYMPTTDRPMPWTSSEGGGYVTMGLPLVKHLSTSQHSNVQPLVSKRLLDALTAIQDTPWRVNRDVLTVLEILWANPHASLPQVPCRVEEAPPQRPADLPFDLKKEDMDEWQLEMLTAYKRARKSSIEAEIRRKSQLLTASQIRVAAGELRDADRFYFPQQLDWRGRAYSVPLFLSPQGPDMSRGLLEFAEAKPLGSDEAGHWFLVTGANHFGADKIPLESRVDWVDLHEDRILAVADDPIADQWWTEAGEPYQFLAWCIEYAKWHETGFDLSFESRKVIAMDGSCNGLQHFSAMLRDARGGAAVNLTPSDHPQDIYQQVCDVVTAKLEVLDALPEPTAERSFARQWLKSGLLDRSVVKRQVMTLPYGATRHGMQDQLVGHLAKVRDASGEDLPFESMWDSSIFLTGHIYAAIGEVVVAASTAMQWLQSVARLASKKGLPLRWRTPHGFVVKQAYRSTRKVRVDTQICGRVQLVIREYAKTIDKKRQAAGVSPNFVHALDSCHLFETVAELPGLHWALVHDSFGCHAADAPNLAKTLRRTFVELYENHDVLAELKADLEADLGIALPDPPTKGDLDIRAVLGSLYFFA